MKTAIMLLLLSTLGSFANAPTQAAQQSSSLASPDSFRQAWLDGFNSKNIEGVVALYDENATLATEAGTFKGRAGVRNWVQASIDQGSKLEEIEVAEQKVSGTMAYAQGESRRLAGGQIHRGRFLIVFEQISGQWKIVQHFSLNVR